MCYERYDFNLISNVLALTIHNSKPVFKTYFCTIDHIAVPRIDLFSCKKLKLIKAVRIKSISC